ncbi:MAG: hypothetical protein ACOC7R_00510 [Planctomycetota bacterium]
MPGHRPTLVLTLALAAASVAAQPADSVLARIPGDSVGFYGTTNTAGAVANLGRFINDVSHGLVPPNLLEMYKSQRRIGRGFRDRGGFAFVVLNPAPFSLDYAAVARGEQAMPPDGPPVAVILPGEPTMFHARTRRRQGRYTIVDAPDGTVYARSLDGYTVTARRRAYVDAVVDASTTVAQVLDGEHLTMLARGDFFAYADVGRLGDAMSVQLDQATARMGQLPISDAYRRPLVEAYAELVASCTTFLTQLRAASAAVTFSDDGVQVDSLISLAPDTPLAAIAQGMRRLDPRRAGRLPAGTYGLAAWAAWEPLTGETLEAPGRLTAAMNPALFAGADPQRADRARRANRRLLAHTLGVQYTVGAPPPGHGLLAMTAAVAVDDAAAVMDEMPAWIEAQIPLIGALLPAREPDGPARRMDYLEDVETVASVTVDAVDLGNVPARLPQQANRRPLALFADRERLRVYIAAVSDDTIVLTFGGGTAYLARAIDAARGGGSLARNADIGRALGKLPLDPMAACVFSLPNTLDVAKNATPATPGPGRDQGVRPLLNAASLRSTTPIAYGAATEGAGVRQTLFVPKALLADVIQNIHLLVQPTR